MNPVFQRSFSSSFPTSGLAGDEERRSESHKLVENDFTPFYSDSYYVDSGYGGGEEYYYHRPRTSDNYYGIRQEYLRSYTFTREEPKKPDKLKDSVKRFRAVVWAVLCCKFKSSKAKMLREKLSSRSSRFIHESTDYISASCRNFNVTTCIRLSTLEVA